MKIKLFSILLLVVLFGCKRKVQDPERDNAAVTLSAQESFVNINKYLLKRYQDQISSFVERMGWEMNKTATGLWYEIYEGGDGEKAEENNVITLHYTISLLDGSVCDSSQGGRPKSFRIGQGGVEAGLEEGALLLRKGDKARFILPPHLAHGNFGDRDKIPPGAILIYQVEVIEIQ